jgi:hypothetical protein
MTRLGTLLGHEEVGCIARHEAIGARACHPRVLFSALQNVFVFLQNILIRHLYWLDFHLPVHLVFPEQLPGIHFVFSAAFQPIKKILSMELCDILCHGTPINSPETTKNVTLAGFISLFL